MNVEELSRKLGLPIIEIPEEEHEDRDPSSLLDLTSALSRIENDLRFVLSGAEAKRIEGSDGALNYDVYCLIENAYESFCEVWDKWKVERWMNTGRGEVI
jgi:hypothetical protein